MMCIAALLFLAVCAYLGAGIFAALDTRAKTTVVRSVSISETAALEGIAIRQEQLICSSGQPEIIAESGSRLPAGYALAAFRDNSLLSAPCSGVFFEETDGFEHLSPDILPDVTVSSLQTLLEGSGEEIRSVIGRVVTGQGWYFAALADEKTVFPENGMCRLHFESLGETLPARLIYLSSPENGKVALVLRLNRGSNQALSLRKTEALLIFSEHSGIEIPKSAVLTDTDGSKFVYTLTAGTVERKAVEIIYTSEDNCIAAFSPSADALREGDRLIISGENIYEGRILR